MKQLIVMTVVFALAAVGFCALNRTANTGRQRLQNDRTNWVEQTQQLARVQAELAAVTANIRSLNEDTGSPVPITLSDPALIDFVLTNNLNSLSLEAQNKLLASLGLGEVSPRDYVVVSKSVLTNCNIRPFQGWPNGSQLTPTVRGVLAITPKEEQSVEAAFADALQKVGSWAQTNIQRQGPTNDMLVAFIIPIDDQFETALTNELFSGVATAIGQQRTDLLQKYFQIYRLYEDGAIGASTNVLSIWRVPGKPGLFYKAGWEMGHWSAVNTYPEPIQTKRFPTAFRYVFPGGWREIAQREGLDLPAASE